MKDTIKVFSFHILMTTVIILGTVFGIEQFSNITNVIVILLFFMQCILVIYSFSPEFEFKKSRRKDWVYQVLVGFDFLDMFILFAYNKWVCGTMFLFIIICFSTYVCRIKMLEKEEKP